MKWDLYEELPDPHGVYRWLRDEAPVYRTPDSGHYALSRYDDVAAALLDYHGFSSRLTAFPRPEHLPVVQMDPPKHDELRAIIIKRFLPREVAKLEGAIRELVNRRLNALAEKGGGDYVSELAELVPSDVVGGMLGIDEEERPALRQWAVDFMSRDSGTSTVPARALVGMESLKSYFIARRREREVRPRDDLMTDVSQALVRGSRLSDSDYGAICAMIAVAGYDTTTNLMSHALLELFRHPDQRDWLVAHPGDIPNAVKETVRYAAPTLLVHRLVIRDVELHGQTIPRGSPVALILASAARDERHYREPERYDVRREDADSLAFGQGRHACFGAPLARLETRIVLEAVLQRFPQYEVEESSLQRSGPGASSGYRRMVVRLGAQARA
jgi:cytochrome P450